MLQICRYALAVGDGQSVQIVWRIRASKTAASVSERHHDWSAAPGGSSRYLTPCIVTMSVGSPSFLRSDAMWTSSVFMGPHAGLFQTSSKMCSRRTTVPGSSASRVRRSNSLGVRRTSSPRTVTRRDRRSIRNAPKSHTRALLMDSPSRATLARLKNCVDPRDEFTKAEWLHDVVVRAEVKEPNEVAFVAGRSQHDKRDVGGLAQVAADVSGVGVGETDSEQDYLRVGREYEPFPTVASDRHVEMLASKTVHERHPD